jgi:hypothetical protein
MLRDPNEALVYLARRESKRAGYHPRLMLTAALYSAGCSRVTVGIDEDGNGPSDGIIVYIPPSSRSVRDIEKALEDAIAKGVIKSDIRQRGNTARLYWRKAS